MLRIDVLRAVTDRTADLEGSCGVCGSSFEMGLVYALISTDGGPEELCERCLRGLCEFADAEDLDVPWRDAHSIYGDARARFTEPMSSPEELKAMSYDDEDRIYREAHLTPMRW